MSRTKKNIQNCREKKIFKNVKKKKEEKIIYKNVKTILFQAKLFFFKNGLFLLFQFRGKSRFSRIPQKKVFSSDYICES